MIGKAEQTLMEKIRVATVISYGVHYLADGYYAVKLCHLIKVGDDEYKWRCSILDNQQHTRLSAKHRAKRFAESYGCPVFPDIRNGRQVNETERLLLKEHTKIFRVARETGGRQ